MKRIYTYALLVGLLLSGCSETDLTRETGIEIPAGEVDLLPVNFQIGTTPMSVVEGIGTRATAPPPKISNLTVLQFGGSTDASVCTTSRYLRAVEPAEGTTVYKVGLLAPKIQGENYIVILANAGSLLQKFAEQKKTYGDFKKLTAELDQQSTADDNVIMVGSARFDVKEAAATGESVQVILRSPVANIHFTWQLGLTVTGATFVATSLQLRNVPKTLLYYDGMEGGNNDASVYPAKNTANFQDYTPIVDQIEDGFSWYIPQNRRGAEQGKATTIWDKNLANAPDEYATYIELSGVYKTPNMPDQLVSYRFFPGQTVTEYDVFPNDIYNVHAVIEGVNSFDLRVNKENFVFYNPANCFMVTPKANRQVVFTPYQAPGADVPNTGVVYSKQMISDVRYSRIVRVGIVWQTSPDLITGVKHEKGIIRITPNSTATSGNALVAAYDKNGQILWSWHVWVTEYAEVILNGINSGIGKQHQYGGYTWMDRNLGAYSARVGQISTYGQFYQWGRKDPFVNMSQDTTMINPMTIADKGALLNIDQSVINPTEFFTVQSTTNAWYGGPVIPDLWQTAEKTIYDPCPYGWMVPAISGWSNFVLGQNFSSDAINNGFNYSGNTSEATPVWFGRSGWLNTNGTESIKGNNALMWSSSIRGTMAFSFYYSFDNLMNNAQPYSFSMGGSIRCVKK